MFYCNMSVSIGSFLSVFTIFILIFNGTIYNQVILNIRKYIKIYNNCKNRGYQYFLAMCNTFKDETKVIHSCQIRISITSSGGTTGTAFCRSATLQA